MRKKIMLLKYVNLMIHIEHFQLCECEHLNMSYHKWSDLTDEKKLFLKC